jgi:hypothetical protein
MALYVTGVKRISVPSFQKKFQKISATIIPVSNKPQNAIKTKITVSRPFPTTLDEIVRK